MIVNVLHQIDYELPTERDVESKMLYYTAVFGIGLGITNMAIYGAEQRSKKVKADRVNSKIDGFSKDVIDDSYHDFSDDEFKKGEKRNVKF